MHARLLGSTVARILGQLRHDRPTVALVLVMPIVLLTLVKYMFEGNDPAFQRAALVMLGIFPFVLMFVVTSIAMLRERSSGTLERLLTTPIGKLDILFGYGLAFAVAATVQGAVATALAYWLLGLQTAGPVGLVVLIAVANAVLGVALGLLCSSFARTEFQAVQFMPAVAFPQLLLCGLFVPREEMASWLEAISNVLPLSYSVEALLEVGANTDPTGLMWRDLGIVAGGVAGALVLGGLTLRRRSA